MFVIRCVHEEEEVGVEEARVCVWCISRYTFQLIRKEKKYLKSIVNKP